jgi:hypothetical protein
MLSPVLAAAGIDGDDCADLLALPVPHDADNERGLAERVQAVLSERRPGGAFAGALTFTTDAVPQLRDLAERSWAA